MKIFHNEKTHQIIIIDDKLALALRYNNNNDLFEIITTYLNYELSLEDFEEACKEMILAKKGPIKSRIRATFSPGPLIHNIETSKKGVKP